MKTLPIRLKAKLSEFIHSHLGEKHHVAWRRGEHERILAHLLAQRKAGLAIPQAILTVRDDEELEYIVRNFLDFEFTLMPIAKGISEKDMPAFIKKANSIRDRVLRERKLANGEISSGTDSNPEYIKSL